jgi:asparagine synthase (glutamine-hydrolysing)
MCGIAGWVDFTRDVRREQAATGAMTATMACRGPDEGGVQLAEHAALGHRRLAIIDLPGGHQPMSVTDDHGDLVAAIVYSGEVYNHLELRVELSALGHTWRTESDTETVLHAYLQWGAGLAERLNGMFAFAVWDERRQQLHLVRDRMGVKPLFYQPTAGGVLFGSEPKAIHAHPEGDHVVDLAGLREQLAMTKNPERSVYRGLAEVRPGQIVTVRPEGLTKRRYWQLEARRHTDDLPTTVGTVRDLLSDIVRRQLISDVPLCSLLSGGLDSSAVTALAAAALREQGEGPVRSFAVDFEGYEDNFVADPMRDSPDSPFVHELAKHVGADHSDIVLSNDDLMDPAAHDAVVRANDAPLMSEMFTSLYLLFKEIRGHSTVALSGESADEVFGGYRWFHDPAAVAADTFPWLAAARTMRGGSFGDTTLLDRSLVRELDLDGHREASYRAAVAEVPHVPGADARERRMREVCYLHLTRFVQILLDRKDRMSMASGLEVRVPFCDDRLVQYVFNTPWAMKTFDGREKSLLRAAVADDLPQSILARTKSPYPSTQDPGYTRALRRELASVLAAGDGRLSGLLDLPAARAMAGSDEGLADPGARSAVELVLGLSRWLGTGVDLQLT